MKPPSSLAENLHLSDIRAVTTRVNTVNGIKQTASYEYI